MRKRSFGVLVAAALLLTLAVRHPSADIRILTHDTADLSPHRVQAALDMGLLAVNILVTWTGAKVTR